jgi:membrane-bound acyltransferase YfiQ involved in biofilm formation
MLHDNRKQKSLSRRFLLILGVLAFIAFLIFGLMIMFWSKLPLDMPKYQRIAFGSVVIIYSVLRFSRLLKKQPDEK